MNAKIQDNERRTEVSNEGPDAAAGTDRVDLIDAGTWMSLPQRWPSFCAIEATHLAERAAKMVHGTRRMSPLLRSPRSDIAGRVVNLEFKWINYAAGLSEIRRDEKLCTGYGGFQGKFFASARKGL
ncbi:hypothetical protein DFH09DRAFT_1083359 [Mycena vulgaris]|nr:hypothetical protein DFH09DRAFT_1083359 [Mycena vulgaris]